MTNKIIFIRYGELMLKGKNQKVFKNKLQTHLQNAFKLFNLELVIKHDKAQIKNYSDTDEQLIISTLERIPGLHSYSIGHLFLNDDKQIISYVKRLLLTVGNHHTYKIETKRLDKTINYTSLDFSKRIARLLNNKVKDLILDVKNYSKTIYFELINSKELIMYCDKVLLLGGLPAQSQGRAIGLISGGIDSPVASILMLKKGINLELIHFESTPMTPLESIDKVFNLVSKIAGFCPKQQIKLHVVPFINIHQSILKNVDDSYIITILRRMMYRLVSLVCDKYDINTIISGDSVGQVASQTLESLATVGEVSKYNILRPLAAFDKEDIIAISKKYDFYNTAILPFEDCCTVYLPHNPATKPTSSKALFWEEKFNYIELLNEAFLNIITVTVEANKNYQFKDYGLDFKSSYEKWKNEHDNK